MTGYITKGIGGFYYVKTSEGIVECKPRGIFRKQKITPVAGDVVTLETEKGGAVIADIAPRRNVFVRPPMANLDVTVGEEYAGAVMGDISTRRGRIVGTDSNDAGETVIMVRVPYAEVVTYTKDLRAITRGSGSYSIELEGYEPAPADVTKKLVEAYQAARAAGN